MQPARPTLSDFLTQQLRQLPGGHLLAALITEVAVAAEQIAGMTARGALGGFLGATSTSNSQGETQKKLDLLAHEALLERCAAGGQVAGIASEELEQPHVLGEGRPLGPFLLLVDPLDGSSNTDVNVSIGTIFSVLRHGRANAPATADFLQPGHLQVAAGYALYGPATMLVLTLGQGTHGFTLDPARREFVLTHPSMAVPKDSTEFAINASNERFWEPPVARYIGECKAGKTGPRGRDFNTRWIASMVAEVHRILMRGGVFLYPRDTREPGREGRLRLMYEANPLGMVVEQAGGLASTGRARILSLQPAALHQRVPVILGSRHEVERIERYHGEHDQGTDQPFMSPLFNQRSLYRPQALA